MLINEFLLLGAALFCIGVYGVIARRNGIMRGLIRVHPCLSVAFSRGLLPWPSPVAFSRGLHPWPPG